MTASVALQYVGLLTDHCERNALPAERLFSAAGLDPAVLADREARLPYAGFQALLATAAHALDDPDLGLHVGQHALPGYYGPYGYTLITSRTPRELLACTMRYSSLVSDACRVEIVERDDELVRYWRSNLPGNASVGRLPEQLNACAWLTMARWVTASPELRPRWVAFRHSVPESAAEYEAIFRCPLRFDAPETALSFDLGHLDKPLPQADPQMRRMMEAMCRRLEHKLGTTIVPGWLSACRRAIVDGLGAGTPRLEPIAAAIDCAPAELRQRLADRGTSFRDLVDELRRDLTLDYLPDLSLSLVDVAYLTGFSEQSAFQRAFKRWTGQTPRRYREGMVSGAR